MNNEPTKYINFWGKTGINLREESYEIYKRYLGSIGDDEKSSAIIDKKTETAFKLSQKKIEISICAKNFIIEETSGTKQILASNLSYTINNADSYNREIDYIIKENGIFRFDSTPNSIMHLPFEEIYIREESHYVQCISHDQDLNNDIEAYKNNYLPSRLSFGMGHIKPHIYYDDDQNKEWKLLFSIGIKKDFERLIHLLEKNVDIEISITTSLIAHTYKKEEEIKNCEIFLKKDSLPISITKFSYRWKNKSHINHKHNNTEEKTNDTTIDKLNLAEDSYFHKVKIKLNTVIILLSLIIILLMITILVK